MTVKIIIDIEDLVRWTYQVQRAEEVVDRLMGREHAWFNGGKGTAAFAGGTPHQLVGALDPLCRLLITLISLGPSA